MGLRTCIVNMFPSKHLTELLLQVLSIQFALTCVVSASDSVAPVVETKQGGLEGLVLKSRDGHEYYAFRGIPYAEYPGRFQVANTHATWDGVRSAKEYGSICAQMDLLNPITPFSGEEDCLFMNIYTPTLSTNASLPVLFWIHGGAFMSWTGNTFDGKYFVDENVILVTINYRLGPLGFLYLSDNGVEGNIGLKDQLLGLKWVQKNIKKFGGDPNKVTVAGFSAGAASTQYHVISPMSKGLFRAAISHSGVATGFWALQENPRNTAVKLASAVGCPIPETDTASTEETVSCLKSKPAQDVVLAQGALKEWFMYPIVAFAPVIEPAGPNSFLTEPATTALQKGNFNKVNWMTGMTEEEGLMFSVPYMLDANVTEVLNSDWSNKLPIALGYQHLPAEEKDTTSKSIREHYFDDYDIGDLDLTRQSLTDLFTDRYWTEPSLASIYLHSQHSRVFPFIFRFTGDFSAVNAMFGVKGDYGIAHGDDLLYLFPGGSYGAPDYSDGQSIQIVEFSRRFVKLIASFIHNMKPTATWEKQRIWRSVYHARPDSRIPFYEIAIETSTWDVDVPARIKPLTEHLPTVRLPKSPTKTEL